MSGPKNGKGGRHGMAAKMPTARRSDSLDPREFDRDWEGQMFSVVHRLRSRYVLYEDATSRTSAAVPFNARSFPNAIRRSLVHIKARTFQIGEPKLFALTYCALEHGLQAISGKDEFGYEEHPVIQSIRNANQALERADWPNKEVRRVVQQCADTARFNERLLPEGGYSKWQFWVPLDCSHALSGFASDLGVDTLQVVVLCLMVTLSTQEEELPDQRAEYARLVAEFLERLQLRADVIFALVDSMSEGRKRRERLRKEEKYGDLRRLSEEEFKEKQAKRLRKEKEQVKEIQEKRLRERLEEEEGEDG